MLLTDALELSRWQFATTTLYHFIFVPLTLGLAPLLASCRRSGTGRATSGGCG